MMPSRYQPIEHRAAWKASDFPGKDDLAIDLRPRHLQALNQALAQSRRLALEELTRERFPLLSIAEELAAWRHELSEGSGLLLFRGLPVDDYSTSDWERLFLGLGVHFGRPVSQSNLGDLVGHVVNIGDKDRRERAYRNSRALNLHTDRCDYIGMLCLRQAKSGGTSGYASALIIHNEILERRPELLEPLYRGYRLHRFGEQPPGHPPVSDTPIPVFSECDGQPTVIFIRGYIDLAVEEGHCELSEQEREALDLFDTIAARPDVCLNLMLEPGEATITNNCVLLHNRDAFEDGDAPKNRRHLLRLWLTDPDRPATDAIRAHKTGMGILKQTERGDLLSRAWLQAPGRGRRLLVSQVAHEALEIDVGTAHQHAHAFTPQTFPQRPAQGRGRGGTGRLYRELHRAKQQIHGATHLVVFDHHQLVHVTLAQSHAVRRGLRRAETVGNGVHLVDRLWGTGLEAPVHGIGAAGLDAIHLALRLNELDRGGDTRAEPAATDGHDHRVQIRHLGTPFQPHRGGAEDGGFPFERMHEVALFLFLDPLHLGERLADVVDEYDLCAKAATNLHPQRICRLRHHHLRCAAHQPSRERHRDRMITGAHRRHPSRQRRPVEAEDIDQRPPRLERPRVLKQL